jgi:hypothetical protein
VAVFSAGRKRLGLSRNLGGEGRGVLTCVGVSLVKLIFLFFTFEGVAYDVEPARWLPGVIVVSEVKSWCHKDRDRFE